MCLLPLEYFASTHAMYRCYGPSVRALREHFDLVAVTGNRSPLDEKSAALFHQTHEIDLSMLDDIVKGVCDLVEHLRPDVVYYPSIGMWPYTIALANMRLAPVQIMSLGHPASSRSDRIDYVVTEQGYMGDPSCFSERVVLLPNHSMPFEMRPDAVHIPPEIRTAPDPLRIAVPGHVM